MNKKLSIFSKLILAVYLLSSCGGGGSRDISRTTNWRYNDPDNGGFEVNFDYEQETGPGLVLIEGGTFTMGRVEQDVMYRWDNRPRRVTVPSFYMDETDERKRTTG